MSGAAKVTRIDAVAAVATALRSFHDDALAALDELQMEVNRALDWIENDRKNYWREAVRRGWNDVAEARAQLEQARSARRMAGYEPSCREEQKMLEKAKKRLDLAQEKVEAVRHWCHTVEKAVSEYRGSMTQFARWLEADLPRALVTLQRMLAALDAYVATAMSTDVLAAGQAAAAAEAAAAGENRDASSPDNAECPSTSRSGGGAKQGECDSEPG